MMWGAVRPKDKKEHGEGKWSFLSAFLEKGRRQWVSLLLMTFTLGIAVRCIEQSSWISPQPSLLLSLVIGVAVAAALLKTRLHFALVASAMTLAGLAVIGWQLFGLVPSINDASTDGSLLSGLKVLAGSLDQTNIAVALIFLVFVWVMACLSAWFLVRKNNGWVAVTLGALAILLNLRYITDDFYPYFLFYMFSAMLLLGQANLPVLSGTKTGSSLPHARHTVVGSVAALIVVTTVIALGVWAVPAFRFNSVQSFIAAKMDWGGRVVNSGANVFTTVSSKQTVVTSAGRELLVLGGNDESGEDVQFVVTSPVRPPYWQVHTYDVYFPWGWGSSPVTTQNMDIGAKSKDAAPAGKYGTFTYKVLGKVKTDLVLTGDVYVSSDIPVSVQSVFPGDVVAVSSTRLLDYGESYAATSRMNLAAPADLAQSGSHYPQEIADRYLQIPSALPRRVPQLARRITTTTQTPYEKAQTIQNYLYQLPYIEAGTSPPHGADGVDYFIFDAKRGNCSNFASAMAVMLRTVGVPARVATGYLPRDWNEAGGVSVLHARDYHAWVQVYFPGSGWVDFEATPSSGAGDAALAALTASAISPDIEQEIPQEYVDEYGMLNLNLDVSEAPLSGGPWLKLLLAAAGLALLVFVVVVAKRKLSRYFRRGDYAAEIYYRMCLSASLLRLGPNPSETPVEYCDRLAENFPQQAESIAYIGQIFQEKRFGPNNDVGWRDRQNLRYAWQMLSRAMFRRLFALERRRPFHEVLVLGMANPRR